MQNFGTKAWRLYGVLAAIIALTMVIVACGGDDEAAPTATTAPAAVAAEPTATTAPADAAPATKAPLPFTPTAMPTATATPFVAREAVEPRLRVASTLPEVQVRMFFKSFPTHSYMRNIYDQLIWNQREDEAHLPFLATEWSVDDTVKNWTFKLREGVTFHNGDTFDAHDVQWSWWAMYSPNRRANNIPAWEKKLEATPGCALEHSDFESCAANIEIVNDYEVTFHLDSPWIGLPVGADERHPNTMAIYSKEYWAEVGLDGYEEAPVGTGPFKYKELVFNEHILFERYKTPGDDHWWQIPEFTEYQHLFVSEDATRLAMVLTGEAAIADLSALLIDEAERQGLVIGTSTTPGAFMFGMFSGQNHRQLLTDGHGKLYAERLGVAEGIPVFYPDDALVQTDVRKAINHAINRDAIQEAFYGNRVMQDSAHGIHSYREPYKAEWVNPYPYDSDLAKQMLADAGYPDGLELDCYTSDQFAAFPEMGEVVEAIVAGWQGSGIDCKIEILEQGPAYMLARGFTVEVRDSIVFLSFPVLDIEILWNSQINGPGSAAFYEPALYENLISYQNATTAEERRNLEHYYGDRMIELSGTIPLFARMAQSAINPQIVSEYIANYGDRGAVFHHEFTKPVYK